MLVSLNLGLMMDPADILGRLLMIISLQLGLSKDRIDPEIEGLVEIV